MKHRNFLLFLLLILPLPVLQSQSAYLYGRQVLEISTEIKDFFPREENSANEKALFTYLEDQFSRNGISYTVLDYSTADDNHSFSRGYSAKIKGEKGETLIIAVPLNNKQGQNYLRNGSVNIALAIELLRIFSRFTPPVSLQFLFLGAERGTPPVYPIGSAFFLKNNTPGEGDTVLYLDITAPGDRIVLHDSSSTDLSPYWLVNSIGDILSRKNIDFTFENTGALAYQSGFETPPPVLDAYFDNDVPVLLMDSTVSADSEIPDEQWINELIESFLTFILDEGSHFKDEWDRHYLAGVFSSKLYVLNEKGGIFILWGSVTLLTLMLFLKSRNLHLNLKRFSGHLWTFPLLFFLLFLYLFLSTLMIEELSSLRDFPDFWTQNPLLFLLFKVFFSMTLFWGFLYLIRGISISPSHHFYTYSAFLSVLISLATALVFNLTFSYFFLWSLAGISLFMISRKTMIKQAAIIITPLPLVLVALSIFTEPFFGISRFLLMSRISGNLFLTIIIMPTIMLFSSLDHYIHRHFRNRRSLRNLFILIFWTVSTISVVIGIQRIEPYSGGTAQPVDISESIDLNGGSRSIEISSPAPIGDIGLKLDKLNMNLTDVGRNAQITAPMISNLVKIERESSSFLDRMSLHYTIETKGTPDRMKIGFSSDDPLIIFDSNYPSILSADGRSVSFSIGINPPVPLELNVIIPRNLTPRMDLDIEYSDFPYDFSLSRKDFELRKKMTVTYSVPWEK